MENQEEKGDGEIQCDESMVNDDNDEVGLVFCVCVGCGWRIREDGEKLGLLGSGYQALGSNDNCQKSPYVQYILLERNIFS